MTYIHVAGSYQNLILWPTHRKQLLFHDITVELLCSTTYYMSLPLGKYDPLLNKVVVKSMGFNPDSYLLCGLEQVDQRVGFLI